MEITKVKEVVRQDIADELKLVQFVDGKNTTNTIKGYKENEKNAIIKEFLAHQETIKSNRNNARTSFRKLQNSQLKH